jgi:hypothetical protein
VSWLLPRPPVQVGESVTFTAMATTLQDLTQQRGPLKARRRGRQWLVGGRLSVTDRRLVFLPARYNRWFGGQSLTVALADIAGVRLEIAAGLSDRRAAALPAVAVTHSGGTTLIAVTRSQELMRALRPVRGHAAD